METLALIELVVSLWPIFLGIISLVIVLAHMYVHIQVLQEKVKTLFSLINKEQ